jgi:hypothetical protein
MEFSSNLSSFSAFSILKTWHRNTNHPHLKSLLFKDCSEYYTDSTDYGITAAKNTGFYIPRGKDKLVIVSGESWTYGDNINSTVQVRNDIDDKELRISNNFSGRITQYLNADLLFRAIPGCSNKVIINNLRSLINCIKSHTNFKNYKEIYVIAQLTSPSRDWHETKDLGKDIKNPKFDDWFKLREKRDIDSLIDVTKELSNAKICIWKNFHDFINDYEVTENETYIKKSWSNYQLNVQGINDIELPMVMESEQWPEMMKEIEIFKNIPNVMQHVNKDLDKLEYSYDMLKESPINNHHPDETNHFLWAMNIINQCNWNIR